MEFQRGTSPINTNTNLQLYLQARGGIEQDVLESYCWMYSTWNIPKEYKGACSGGDQVKILHKFLPNSQKRIFAWKLFLLRNLENMQLDIMTFLPQNYQTDRSFSLSSRQSLNIAQNPKTWQIG